MGNEDLVRTLRATVQCDTQLELIETKEAVLSARYKETFLASKYRPLTEAKRLADTIDVIDSAIIAILGFGLGYHVAEIAKRLKKTGLIVVYEPDIKLLYEVLSNVDLSKWFYESNVLICTDATDRGRLSASMEGAAAIFAIGTKILPHPASKARLGDRSNEFLITFTEVARALRTTIMTTLIHSVTTCRNLALNLDHYACGNTITPLKDWAQGHAAILVSAGPGLARNITLLKTEGLRDRVVIIAVQTVVKTLLAHGIKPHFITSLDYHEISKQFYEGLSKNDVEGMTLVCEPKANRSILESFPGTIRCCGNAFLDTILGDDAQKHDTLTAGATVAHLSLYLAQYIGCDPIVLIGQDLGFSDGLYYGPNAAIHEQWAPELNRFNTIEMMEWQRIARMKRTLSHKKDLFGKIIYYDEQMLTYLQQFEAEFQKAPQRIIDATQGGVPKQNVEIETLANAIEDMPDKLLPEMIPGSNSAGFNKEDIDRIRGRLEKTRQDILHVSELSHKAHALLLKMLDSQDNQNRMKHYFDQMDTYRDEIDKLSHAMRVVNALNQLGAFKRLRADRAIELTLDADPKTRQRTQLERDIINVQWLKDGSDEMLHMLDESDLVLQGEYVDGRVNRRLTDRINEVLPETSDIVATPVKQNNQTKDVTNQAETGSIVAMIAADINYTGLGLPSRLQDQFLGRSVLQCTLERVGQSKILDTIILVVENGSEIQIEALITRSDIAIPVEIVSVDDPLYNSHKAAIAASRRFCETSWRGGIGGMSIFDEAIYAEAFWPICNERNYEAILIVGADWVFIDPSNDIGCDSLITRRSEHPDEYRVVFTQAPPGLSGCVLDCRLLEEMYDGARQATLGAALSYMPHLPQLDPISKDMCIKLPLTIRSSQFRVTYDTQERIEMLHQTFDDYSGDPISMTMQEVNDTIQSRIVNSAIVLSSKLPTEVELEITTDRLYKGPVTAQHVVDIPSQYISLHTVATIMKQLSVRKNTLLTIGGRGDPLLHDEFVTIINMATSYGISCINVRTDLLCSTQVVDALLDLPIDIITVMLQADDRNNYLAATDSDRFQNGIDNLERLLNRRAEHAGSLGHLAKPLIVPTMTRCEQTINDIRNFYDRWVYYAGAVLIEPHIASGFGTCHWEDPLIRIYPPDSVYSRINTQRMNIRADGTVIAYPGDWLNDRDVGNVDDKSVEDIWKLYLDSSQQMTRNTISEYALPTIEVANNNKSDKSLFTLQDDTS